jgi:hypothetical protein
MTLRERSVIARPAAAVLVLLGVLAAAGPAGAQALPPAAQRLYEQARGGRWFADAQRLAPSVAATTDGRSFVALWRPGGPPPERWIVSLHGTGGFATDDLALWHRHLGARRLGVIALQWWLGEDQGPRGYYAPEQIYRELDAALRQAGVRPGTALLQGFSRGSANLYAVAAHDGARPARWFSLFVASSGRASLDFPPNRAITDGRLGARPLARTRWITVCGARDPNPERDGCPGMRATAQWLRDQGGEVVAAIEDPRAGHGALHLDPDNVRRVLDLFEGAPR